MYRSLSRKNPKTYLWLFIPLFVLGLLIPVWLSSRRQENLAGEALHYAMTRINRPYLYGGKGPDCFDCSGLVIWSYKAANPDLKFRRRREWAGYADTQELWKYNVKRIAPNQMKPGDLVFMTDSIWNISHIGLFVRWITPWEFEYIHASMSLQRVTISTRTLKEKIPGYRFAGAGRLLIRKFGD